MKTVAQIADFVAPYVGLNWPSDRDRIFALLSMTQDQIWNAGKFHGSTKWFYVNIRDGNTIITPHGYNVLLGCNVNFKPVNINDKYFMFHKNGPGDNLDCDFNDDVIHLGDEPVFRQPKDFGDCMTISVKSIGCSNGRVAPKTKVSGYRNGNPIYTYVRDHDGKPVLCGDIEETTDDRIEAIEGIEYPITANYVNFDNIIIDTVYNINKEPTPGPVEYYALNLDNRVATMIARLEPFETMANYKLYRVGRNCVHAKSILGLFKMSKPVDIVDENQFYLTSNTGAIISIAKGLTHKHEKDDIATGDAYIRDGILELAKEVRENKGVPRMKMQVQSGRDHSKIPKF